MTLSPHKVMPSDMISPSGRECHNQKLSEDWSSSADYFRFFLAFAMKGPGSSGLNSIAKQLIRTIWLMVLRIVSSKLGHGQRVGVRVNRDHFLLIVIGES